MCKISVIQSKANIFKFVVEWKKVGENVRFSTENWPYLAVSQKR